MQRKHLTITLLALALIFALTACGNTSGGNVSVGKNAGSGSPDSQSGAAVGASSSSADAPASGSGSAPVSETATTMQLAEAEGTVGITDDAGKQLFVRKDMRLYDGYRLETEQLSYAWINLDNSKLTKLDAASGASVHKQGKKLEISLDSGSIFFNVAKPLEDDESLNIRTSTMVVGIRGTCGWVRVAGEKEAQIAILEGTVQVAVSDPVTGETKTDNITGGETVTCVVYDPEESDSDVRCDILRSRFEEADVPGFVLVDVVKDEGLVQKILEKTNEEVDLRSLTRTDAVERLTADEEQAAIKAKTQTDAPNGNAQAAPVPAAPAPIVTPVPVPAPTPTPVPAPAPTPEPTPEPEPEPTPTPMPVIHTVTFHGNGGIPIGFQIAVSGGVMAAPAAPARTGYAFGGWYREAGCVNAWNFATDTVTGNMTLYAKWTLNRYTVTFNAAGGGAVPGGTASYNTAIARPADPTRTGYTFGGWYREAAYTTAWDFVNDTVTGNMTLYAKWIPIPYTVTFAANDGTSDTSTSQAAYGTTVTKPADPTRTGYTFGGWYKEAACTNAWDFAADKVTGDMTLYAKWTLNSYTVTFNADNGDSAFTKIVSHGGRVDAPQSVTEKPGHTLEGWYRESSLATRWDFDNDTVTGSMTLYAKWNINSYTVTFDGSGGTPATNTLQAAYNTTVTKPAPDPARTGYTFDGWYTEAECTTEWNFDTDTVMGDMTLYAKWNINSYTVTFDGSGGTPATNTLQAAYNTTVTKPAPDPARTGYTFGGWYTEAECRIAWNFDTDTVTDDVTLYAKWTLNSYTVTFNANGGSTAPAAVTVNHGGKAVNPGIVAAGDRIVFGWYKDSDCTQQWIFADDEVTGDMILYAKWDTGSRIAFSNTCWNLDSGTLTIGGSGNMVFEANRPQSQPWFSSPGIQRVVIGDEVTSIATWAFYISGGGLTDAIIGKKVETIGSNAFLGCGNLKTITFPASVQTIGAAAFQDCGSLTTVTIPVGIRTINRDVFKNTSLATVTYRGTKEQWGNVSVDPTGNGVLNGKVQCTDGTP